MHLPFTFDELFRAYRRVSSEDEARRMAESFDPLEPASAGSTPEMSKLLFEPHRHMMLTDDTLILLALQSDEMWQKVETYRYDYRCGQAETTEAAQAWERRYAELRLWADAGYPVDAGEE